MTITIDKTGRIVLPKKIRDLFHLIPGSEINAEVHENSIVLKTIQLKGELIRKEGLLIHHSADPIDIDIVDWLQKQREQNTAHSISGL